MKSPTDVPLKLKNYISFVYVYVHFWLKTTAQFRRARIDGTTGRRISAKLPARVSHTRDSQRGIWKNQQASSWLSDRWRLDQCRWWSRPKSKSFSNLIVFHRINSIVILSKTHLPFIINRGCEAGKLIKSETIIIIRSSGSSVKMRLITLGCIFPVTLINRRVARLIHVRWSSIAHKVIERINVTRLRN